MKKICTIFLICLVSNCYSNAYSQDLTTGVFSGINISDIHGNSITGKWKFKPGPVQGAFINYNFSRILGISTGVNYSTVYYEYKPYMSLDPMMYSSMFSSSSYYPQLYSATQSMDYSFITIPLQLRLTIPSKPDLSLTAGTYYSFVQDQNPETETSYKSDLGYLFSAGVSYPFNDDFSGLLNVRYLAGTKDMNPRYRNGSIDFTIGVAFNGFLNNKDKFIMEKNDTSLSRVRLIYFGGVNLSWNGQDLSRNIISGPAAGFRVDFLLGNKVAFRTGLSFEQKGYSFKDSSDLFYGKAIDRDPQYMVDTRTLIDYIEIPASLKFGLGRSNRVYFSTGPWYALRLNAHCTGNAMSVSDNNSTYRLTRTTVYDDIGRLIKTDDLGWSFGTGVSVPFFGKTEVEIGVEYKHGFGNVFDMSYYKSNNPFEIQATSITNRSFSFHMGLVIPGMK